MKLSEADIYKKAIDTFGPGAQLGIAQEELAELIVAISKYSRGKPEAIIDIAEEIADVQIMLDQLSIMFHLHEKIERLKHEKLKRLEWRLFEESK